MSDFLRRVSQLPPERVLLLVQELQAKIDRLERLGVRRIIFQRSHAKRVAELVFLHRPPLCDREATRETPMPACDCRGRRDSDRVVRCGETGGVSWLA